MERIREGWRIFLRSLRKRFTHKYTGSAEDICKAIVQDCWNGVYFQTSVGHFSGFYIRDFAWVVEALMELGYKDKVKQTLAYVLDQYEKHGHVTTTLTPDGRAVDIHAIGPDSLAMLLRSLRIAKCGSLVRKHKKFLQKEAKRYYYYCFDPNLGLVRRKRYFSSMRDIYRRDSSCYDNCMIALISEDLDHFRLKNPFKGYNLPVAMEKNLWTGGHFAEDLTGEGTADANVIPYFWHVIKDKKKVKKSIQWITENKLDHPFPLAYATKRNKKKELPSLRPFAGNYEGTAIWGHLGTLYILVLCDHNKKLAKKHLAAYTQLIEHYGTFPEVYNSNGKQPFSTWSYYCDEGMIWAANYLLAKKKLKS